MENTKILKHIYLDKFFLFFLLIVILTGNFNYFISYFLLFDALSTLVKAFIFFTSWGSFSINNKSLSVLSNKRIFNSFKIWVVSIKTTS